MATPQPAHARDLVGKKLGRYEVLAQLASGGMATVYAARSQGVAGFERLVAIKVLHPHLAHDDEFISMFLDEARLAARIRHPNVVPTLDISDSHGDGFFLVMEYIEGDHFGGLLREAAKGGKRLPPGVSLRIVLDALEGLNAAHSLADGDGRPLGIVHRDISPHNILLGVDGVARITDFGVAKAEVRLSSTRDGQFKGKLSYMAPEQASSGFADQRSDLFSMGIVAWEALTARRLFRADNNGELLNRVLNAPIPKPSEIDPSIAPLDAVILKALERDASKRFQNAAEFVEALEAAGGGLTATGQTGIASPRLVGKSVREWLGAKIDAEQARIKTSIESLGKSEMMSNAKMPRPIELSGMTPTPSEVRSVEAAAQRVSPEDLTVGAKPSSIDHEDEAPNRKGLVIGGALALTLVLGVGIAWAGGMFGGREVAPPPITTVSLPRETEPPPLPPVVAPEDEAVVAPPPAAGAIAAVSDEVAAEVDDPGDVPTEEESTVRRRRRNRGASTAGTSTAATAGTTETGAGGSAGGAATGGTTTGTTAGTATRTSGDDDDLLLANPYRN